MTTVILQQIISPYGDIEESVVIFPEELIAVSTNEELKADTVLKKGGGGELISELMVNSLFYLLFEKNCAKTHIDS